LIRWIDLYCLSNSHIAQQGKGAMAKKDEAAMTQPDEKAGFNVNAFVQETKEEFDKVVWPSRQQLLSESLAVILMVSLSATLIYLADEFFRWAGKAVFG
jgi:preprotein translocase subunit SecE